MPLPSLGLSAARSGREAVIGADKRHTSHLLVHFGLGSVFLPGALPMRFFLLSVMPSFSGPPPLGPAGRP